ncbi:MAG TPA: PqqD family protein [Thermoanaerobaculia bacterium]|nr:PqqD family protein [Thermoanaerobaculia bacterium]
MEYPQKISGLATEAVGDGLAVLANGQKYVLNATSALVLEHCDGQTSPEQLAEIVRQKFSLLPAEAEPLAQLALEELETSRLLMPAAVHPATFSRRQALSFATLGLSLALVPLVQRVAQAQGGTTLVPLLECVDNNGDGTFTAHFGYLNTTGNVITLPIGPKNMFVGGEQDRGQPVVFYPGEHLSEFTVVFDALDTLKWLLKADGDRRHQVEASATSEVCATTTFPPTT